MTGRVAVSEPVKSEEAMSEKAKATEAAEGSPPREAVDPLERLVAESLSEQKLVAGDGNGGANRFVERVMSHLPSREAMRPLLHPALRAAYGLVATVFAVAAWQVDLPARIGATGTAGSIVLAALVLQAAVGALVLGFSLYRDAGPAARCALGSILACESRAKTRALAATVAGAIMLAAAWMFLDWFPAGVLTEGMRAARASAAALLFVLIVAAAFQIWMAAKGREWRSALKLVEAVGLVVAGIACAANYVIFAT